MLQLDFFPRAAPLLAENGPSNTPVSAPLNVRYRCKLPFIQVGGPIYRRNSGSELDFS